MALLDLEEWLVMHIYFNINQFYYSVYPQVSTDYDKKAKNSVLELHRGKSFMTLCPSDID